MKSIYFGATFLLHIMNFFNSVAKKFFLADRQYKTWCHSLQKLRVTFIFLRNLSSFPKFSHALLSLVGCGSAGNSITLTKKNCVLLLSQLTFGELGTRGRYVIDRLVVSRILFKVQFYEQDEIKDSRWSILYFEPIFPIKLTNDHAGSFEWKISRIRGNITCQNPVHFFLQKTRQKNWSWICARVSWVHEKYKDTKLRSNGLKAADSFQWLKNA